MNKQLFSLLTLFTALFVGAIYYNTSLQTPISSFLNSIKATYLNSISYVSDSIDEHFRQQSSIIDLREKLDMYKETHLISQQVAVELNQLFQENNSSLKTKPEVELVRSISYAKFGDHNKIWLDMPDFNTSKVYGLTANELTAGIVVASKGQALALLNGDIKSSYAVYIGENKAPGIVHGNNEELLIVDFVPTWIPIKVGDEVLTSGLDRLFFEGLKVGVVVKIEQAQGYRNATIKPYYNASNPNYFHVIKEVR